MNPPIKTFAILCAILFSTNALAQQGMGVGTNNPLEMLHVTGAIKVGTDINNSSAAPSGGAGTIRFKAGQFEGWDGASWIPLGGGTGSDDQNLTGATLSGTTLQIDIEGGSSTSVNLSALVNDADADATNEIQTLSLSGNTLAISSGNNVSLAGFANTDNQNLSSTASGTNRTINISGGTGTTISVADNDNDATNEYNTGVSLSGTQLQVTDGGGTQSVDLAGLVNDNDWTVAGSNMYSSVSGLVGIGTTSPNFKLHLHRGAYTYMQITNAGSGTSTTDGMLLGFTGGNEGRLWVRENWPLTFLTNNNERMRITETGYIGIGTNAPSEKLHVTGSIQMVDGSQAAGYIPVSDANGKMTWTDPATISTASDDDWTTSGNDIYNANMGNVGIGTSTPDRQLNIESATGPQMLFTRDDNNTTDGEVMGELLFDNNDDTAPSSVDAAAVIRATASGPQGNSNKGGNIVFLTKNSQAGTVNATERMRISANGNVGVGTNSPDEVLHVSRNTGNAIVKIESPGSSYEARMEVHKFGSYSAGVGYYPGNADLRIRTNTNNSIVFEPNGTEAMRVSNSGNVGIGTTAPTQKLHVAGSIQMVDGNQQAGYIPVSDANGKMTWTDPTTVSDGDWTISGVDMYNSNTGNIGLGDATPNWPVTVSSSNALFSSTDVIDPVLYALTVTRPDGTNDQGIGIGLGGSNSGAHAGAGVAFKKTGNNSLGDLMLTVKADGTSFGPHFPALTIKSISGNVGIGTTAPSEKLHVEGSVRVGPRIGVYNSGKSVLIGENAGANDDLTDNSNTYVGFESGMTSTTGYNNTAVGDRAFTSGNGYDNAAFGPYALHDNVSGVRNTALGARSGRSILGNENTIIGAFAGRNATGSGNVYLGQMAGQDATGDNKLYIENSSSTSPLIYGEFDNDIVGINGDLGVGTTSPNFKVQVHDGAATWMQITNTGSGTTSSDGMILGFTSANEGRLWVRESWPLAFLTNNTEHMRIASDGNVGIGTINPTEGKLVVNGTGGSGSYTYGYLNSSGNTGTSGPNNLSYSIWASGRIRASEFNAMSDARAKTIEQRTNTSEMLDLVNRLTVTEYSYVDTLAHGNRTKQGFIAQEIEAVYPNAINKSTDFIPNVFEKGEVTYIDWITQMATITLNRPHGLSTADHIKLITEDGDMMVDVAKVTETTITVKLEKEVDEVFVYGKQVNDFRAVDYDQVFSIGIAAIQELSDKVEALEAENASLKAELKTEKATNQARLQVIEEQLGIGLKAQR